MNSYTRKAKFIFLIHQHLDVVDVREFYCNSIGL